MFGYLEHAVGTAVTPAARDAALPKILARLDEAYREPFTTGRREVKTQFEALVNQREDADQKAQREVEIMREEVRKEAESGREQISHKRDTLGEEVDRLREEYDSQMQRLRADERPLVEQLARIQASAVVADNEVRHLRVELGRLEALLLKEKDPVLRERLLREIDRLEIRARRYRSELQEHERAALGVQSRLGEVRQQIARVESETGGRLNRADREFDNLDRQQRQIENAERKAKQATGDKRKAHSLSTRASALTTYAPFPVDEERQKLLQSL
jgi:chromosome segregation ATPase